MDISIAVNKAHFPVTVLGPGRRIGIWLQGCSIGCPGCVSQDTWAFDAARQMPVARLLAWCRQVTQAAGQTFDGVTISGGEPFDQPDALAALLDGLAQWRRDEAMEFDLLCYSGYPWERLQQRHPDLLARLDALIPEPYVASQPVTQVWRGSANQNLRLLSPLGEQRYRPYVDMPVAMLSKRIQTMLDGQRVWYVGIPERGDMAALEEACRARGIDFSAVSWRQ